MGAGHRALTRMHPVPRAPGHPPQPLTRPSPYLCERDPVLSPPSLLHPLLLLLPPWYFHPSHLPPVLLPLLLPLLLLLLSHAAEGGKQLWQLPTEQGLEGGRAGVGDEVGRRHRTRQPQRLCGVVGLQRKQVEQHQRAALGWLLVLVLVRLLLLRLRLQLLLLVLGVVAGVRGGAGSGAVSASALRAAAGGWIALLPWMAVWCQRGPAGAVAGDTGTDGIHHPGVGLCESTTITAAATAASVVVGATATAVGPMLRLLARCPGRCRAGLWLRPPGACRGAVHVPCG